jgi:hypothetical protein
MTSRIMVLFGATVLVFGIRAASLAKFCQIA